jgi:hypothetical protein
MRESALTGFRKTGFGSEPDRRKQRPDSRLDHAFIRIRKITTDRCEASNKKHEQRRDTTGSRSAIAQPLAILHDEDNAGALDGRIDGETRMRSSPGKPPSTRAVFHSVSIITIALPISATPLVARTALVAVPPVYSIGTASGRPYAAVPDKVTYNSPDNRTLNATTRSRISLTCEGNGGKAKDGRNEKQLFHG